MHDRLTPVEALLLVLASLVALLSVGGLLATRLGLPGIVLSELLLVLLPTVAVLQVRGVPVARGLGLAPRRDRWVGELGGVLAGAGAFWLMGLVESGVLERVLPTPPTVRESLRRLVVPPGGARPLAIDLFALALVPAVCEEALFRGVVLGALRARGTAIAVGASAVLFGAYHASPYRFLPVTLLGVLLGVIRVYGGSLLPAVAFHATNNLLVVLLLRWGRETVPGPAAPWGAAGLGGALAALAGGLWLVLRTQPR